MNRKQFALLLFLLVVLGIGGLIVYTRQNDVSHAGDPALGKKLLGDFPVNDITHITLKQDTNELNLVKKDNLWRVHERDDYPANYSQISEALLKLRDIKVVQSEKVGASQLPRLALVPGQGTNAALVAEFKDAKDKTIDTLLLGKKHMQKSNRPSPYGDMGEGWPDGRYVKVNNSDTVALISDALTTLEPKPEQWLNKDFFRVDKVRSLALTSPTPTNSWKLTRDSETAEWKLADAKTGEQLDSAKTGSLANSLSSPTFSDVAPAAKADQFGLNNKPTVLNLDTFDNFSYTLKVGVKTNDNYPVLMTVSADLPKERTAGKDEKPEDKTRLDKEFKDKQQKLQEKLDQEKPCEKWVYLVSSWTLEPLLKERNQLMMEKKEEPKKSQQTAANSASPSTPDLNKVLDPVSGSTTNATAH